MKKIFTSEDRCMVWLVKDSLQQSGIDCVIRNQYAAGGSGDLSPHDSWPEVWLIHDTDSPAAMQILQERFESPEVKPDWLCRHCNESNAGSFDFCWNCGHDGPDE